MDLRSPGVNLLDLADLVEWMSPHSALRRSVDPDEWMWNSPEMLQALAVDELRYLGYILLRVNGDLKVKPPKPIPRPGVANDDVETIGGGKGNSLEWDEMADWLGGPFAALNN